MRKSSLIALCLLGLPPALAAAQEAQDRVKANPLARLPLERFVQTRERPLFSAARRLPPPAPVAVYHEPEPPPPPPPPEPPSVVLVGVVTDEQGSRALIRPSPMDKIRDVKIGDDVGGWKVTEIAARRIVFALDARTSAFALFETKNRPAKTAARDKVRR